MSAGTSPFTMEINPQVQAALDALEEQSTHVFVTGRAGTGKSTLLRYFLKDADLGRTVVLAPTGVAAINVGGETIHHFFKFRPGVTPTQVEASAKRLAKAAKSGRVYKALETMVIDEISMVRADLLDMVDLFLRTVRRSDDPFGGVRLLAFGDLYQLPPVVQREEQSLFSTQYHGPYFFDSHVLMKMLLEPTLSLTPPFQMVELKKIYRQSDDDFIDLLNGVRSKTLDAAQLERINSRFGAQPIPGAVHLTTTNATASRINAQHLDALDEDTFRSTAVVTDDFPRSHFPTDEVLDLKVGARLMLLTNDPMKRWVNGTLGTLMDIAEDEDGDEELSVKLDDGKWVRVGRFEWEAAYNFWDEAAKKIDRKIMGTFEQFPVRLAWAITIHKAQGKTFDAMVVDFERSAFAHGQAYVALSRCTTLEGLVLARPMRASDGRLDQRIVRFLEFAQQNASR